MVHRLRQTETQLVYSTIFITAEAFVFGPDGQCAFKFGSRGQRYPLVADVTVSWKIGNFDRKLEDIPHLLTWPCIAKILEHHARIKYDEEGNYVSDAVYKWWLKRYPDPLIGLGWVGWPIRKYEDGAPFSRTMR